MEPRAYYRRLSADQKVDWAIRSGTTIRHMQSMFTGNGFKKRPRDRLIVGLVEASDGAVSLDEAIDYFLVQPVLKLAAELGVLDSVPAASDQVVTRGSQLEIKSFEKVKEEARVGL